MKRQFTKPSDDLIMGMVLVSIQIVFTWYLYVKNKLRQNTTAKFAVSSEAFEEELNRSSAVNGNGKIADEPCGCDDGDDTDIPRPLDETVPQNELGEVEEPDSAVPSLPEEPSASDLAEIDTPETDQH